MQHNLFAFSMPDIHGNTIHFQQFHNQVVLLVNTASMCGFSKQIHLLDILAKEYSDGLSIICIPSHDFGQEHSANSDNVCHSLTAKNIHLMHPQSLSGPNAHPCLHWITTQCSWLARPRWNFYKYIFTQHGQLHAWYSPFTSPLSMRLKREITHLLDHPHSLA